MDWLSLGMTALGGLMSAQGAASEASLTRQNYLYNASTNRFNARLADIRAQDAIEMGRQAEADIARGARKVKGSQVAAAASSGISLSSMNTLNILAGTDALEAQDIATTRENARRAALTEEMSAMQERSAADFAGVTAGGYDPNMARTTSLVNTIGQVADKWYDMKRATEG